MLSNCVNSGIRRISIMTQYKAHSLVQHIQRGWGYLRATAEKHRAYNDLFAIAKRQPLDLRPVLRPAPLGNRRDWDA